MTSCSGDDYINAIPGNSNALLSTDQNQLKVIQQMVLLQKYLAFKTSMIVELTFPRKCIYSNRWMAI